MVLIMWLITPVASHLHFIKMILQKFQYFMEIVFESHNLPYFILFFGKNTHIIFMDWMGFVLIYFFQIVNGSAFVSWFFRLHK